MAEDGKRAAVYVPWATFKNALDQLSQGVPSRIDRSVFPGMAWNLQNQLFTGMKFLGLITNDDEPTPVLDDLVKGTDSERKEKLKHVMEQRYADLIAMDLTKATRDHFEEKIGELYGVTGDTRDRSARFFLNAAKYAGIPLSTFIAPVKDGGTNGTRRTRASTPRPRVIKKSPTPNVVTAVDSGVTSGTSKTVKLISGGELRLSATLDLFALNAQDRQFVFYIIDQLDQYEGGGWKPKP